MDEVLQARSVDERIKLLQMGLVYGNPVMLQYLRSKPSQLKQLQKSLSNDSLMDICRYGSEQSMKMLAGADFTKIRDAGNNSCAHEASRYGNLKVLRELAKQSAFNFNCLNDRHETPLSYSLKSNLQRYQKVALFLLDRTDLSIRDGSHRLPFEVEIPLNQSRARLLEYIEEIYRKQHL